MKKPDQVNNMIIFSHFNRYVVSKQPYLYVTRTDVIENRLDYVENGIMNYSKFYADNIVEVMFNDKRMFDTQMRSNLVKGLVYDDAKVLLTEISTKRAVTAHISQIFGSYESAQRSLHDRLKARQDKLKLQVKAGNMTDSEKLNVLAQAIETNTTTTPIVNELVTQILNKEAEEVFSNVVLNSHRSVR